MSSYKKIISFLLLFLLLSIQGATQEDIITIILPHEEITLKEPIEVSEITMFKDGGTIGATLTDIEGKTFKFCYDGRMSEHRAVRHLFAHVHHPSIEGGVEIPQEGKAEMTILNILKKWLIENPLADNTKKNHVCILIQEIHSQITP